ncbi:hypothetical protein [Paraburkholderia phosphatilytica]|uniref:hypothetical protein n=1 Tax=Paraburkholderia phosphatilytica TaxID=2282883 RepID=UPI001F0C8CA7|nr:hypothetical protein [Paraburkholderia phosphatilytica]
MRRTICASRWLTAAFWLLLSAATAPAAQPIRIESGTYGANCGARAGNVTQDLADRCNALATCRYPVASPVDFRARNACEADLVAEWSCGPGERHHAVVRAATDDGGTLVLTCVPSTGAGK